MREKVWGMEKSNIILNLRNSRGIAVSGWKASAILVPWRFCLWFYDSTGRSFGKSGKRMTEGENKVENVA